MKRCKHICVLLVVAFVLTTQAVMAQKLTMGFIYPAGGQQGSSVDVEIGGLNLSDASSVIVSGKGITTEIIPLPVPEPTYVIGANGKKRIVKKKVAADQSAPQLASRIGVRLHIASDAEVGLRDLRLQSMKGVSNQLSFEVSSYPNVLESQTLTVGKVNEVESLPAVLCGYVQPGEIDRFAFDAKGGTTLVAEVKGRTLVPYIADAVPGWFQPVVRLLDSKGREVAFADDFHTSPDPVMIVRIPKDDRYTLTINDAIYRGRQDFNYRIQLGEIPFVEGAYPLVADVGKSNKMEVKGVNLSSGKVSVKPKSEGVNYLRVKGKNGKLSNRVPYYAVDKGVKIVKYPSPKSELLKNQVIYDEITKPYEQRYYGLPLDKGESVMVDAMSRRVDSRADLKITLLSLDGKVVGESDDVEDSSQGLMTHHADPSITYKAPQEGLYTLIVEDVQGRSGKDCGYVLRRMKPAAPFEAFVSPANISIAQGGTAVFSVDLAVKTRKNFGGLDRLKVEGLPAGYRVSRLKLDRFTKKWDVSITAPKDAALGTFPIEVKAQTLPFKGEEPIEVTAKATDNMMQAFYYTHYIPAAAFVAEIVPAIPYSVRLDPAMEADLEKSIIIEKGVTTIPVKVFIDRQAGFDKELELELSKKSKGVYLNETVKVAPHETEKVLHLILNRELVDKWRTFTFSTCISATVQGEIQKRGKRTFVNALYKDMTPMFVLQKVIEPAAANNNKKVVKNR